MIRKNTILQQCRDYNLRLTSTRRRIINQFVTATRPLSYDECKGTLQMDKATFYRNMHTFESAGLIRKIESDDKKWYFELATTAHAHFICDHCHRVECLEEFPLIPIQGYSVDTVIYKGTCTSCNA
jgi:Fur family ferric uptake transcriptional regulator